MRDYLKQEADRIINYGYKDKYFLKNEKFKKGPNSPNHYVERKLLKSNLFKEFRKEMLHYKNKINKELDNKVANNDFNIDELVKLEENNTEKLKQKKEELKEKVYNKIDNLSNQDILELGFKLKVKENNEDNVCPRCGGLGRIEQYSHIDNGICYKCEGTGKINNN